HVRLGPPQRDLHLMLISNLRAKNSFMEMVCRKIALAQKIACAQRQCMETQKLKPYSAPCMPPATASVAICLRRIDGLRARCMKNRRTAASQRTCKFCGDR